jgi:hypothetical protein
LLGLRDKSSFTTVIGYRRISLRAINVCVRYKYEVNDEGLRRTLVLLYKGESLYTI